MKSGGVLAAAALALLAAPMGASAAEGKAGPAPARTVSPPSGEQARAAYERFRGLEGKWRGRSTRGWEEDSSYRVIAGGSAVLGISFDAHPGETMATLFYLDGDHLELTHYCVAKNAPRLRATRIEDSGRTIHFDFAGGANIPTRDRGHMDRAVFRFREDGTMTSRWSWYQDGKERWMEQIELVRASPEAAPAAP